MDKLNSCISVYIHTISNGKSGCVSTPPAPHSERGYRVPLRGFEGIIKGCFTPPLQGTLQKNIGDIND